MRMAIAMIMILAGCRDGSGSGASAPQPYGHNAPTLYSPDEQHIGAPSDGLVLRSVRQAPHPGYHRIVFDLSLAEGVPATTIPASHASYRPHDKSIELTIHGVRHDLTGNLPLRSEGGQALGKPIPVDHPPVSYFAKELVLDDSAVSYRIQLTRAARFRLYGLDHPVRVVLDIENTGGAASY